MPCTTLPSRMLRNIPETMQLLNISRSMLYELIKSGEIKPIKLGRKTLFHHHEIERFVKGLRE